MKEYKEFIFSQLDRLELIPYRDYSIEVNNAMDAPSIIREVLKRNADAELITEYSPDGDVRSIIKLKPNIQQLDYIKVLLSFIEKDELPEEDLAKFVRGYITSIRKYRRLVYKLMIDLYVDHVLTMEQFIRVIRFMDDSKKEKVESLLQLREFTGQELIDQMVLWRLRN